MVILSCKHILERKFLTLFFSIKSNKLDKRNSGKGGAFILIEKRAFSLFYECNNANNIHQLIWYNEVSEIKKDKEDIHCLIYTTKIAEGTHKSIQSQRN